MCFLKHLRTENSSFGHLHWSYFIFESHHQQCFHQSSFQVKDFYLLPTSGGADFFLVLLFYDCYFGELYHLLSMTQINNLMAFNILRKIKSQNYFYLQNLPSLQPLNSTHHQHNSYGNPHDFAFAKENNHLQNKNQPEGLIREDQQKNRREELLKKLFSDYGKEYGINGFKYKITLENSFPNKVFKNRKFSLKLNLIPSTCRATKVIRHKNIISICIAIFDKDGNWVHQNMTGESIMNGGDHTYLFEGQGQFKRIVINELSSNMAKQRLNIVIYVAPSANQNQQLNGSGLQNGKASFVDWRSVKPLIIRNVKVLSKKTRKIGAEMDE